MSTSKKLDIIQRFMVRLPMGLTLKGSEAEKVITIWKDERKDVERKQWDFEKLATKVQKRLKELEPSILDSAKEVKVARSNYKKSVNPIARRRWARRLVLAGELHKYNRNSKVQLEAMCERVKDAIEDSKLVTNLITSRIADAEIYYQLNGRLKLVGKDLAAATRQYAMPEIEYKNAEFTMEQIEKNLSNKDDDTLLIEAEAIMKEPEEENAGKKV